MRCVCAAMLAFALLAAGASEVLAQSSRHHKKKKIKKPAPVPCRVGCRPETAGPGLWRETRRKTRRFKKNYRIWRAKFITRRPAHNKTFRIRGEKC